MKYMMECLLRIEQKELRQFLYGIFSDTTIMCFLHPEYVFPEFYNLRRILLKQICEMFDFRMKDGPLQKRKDGKIHKICILPNMLYDKKSSVTRLCFQVGEILADMGHEVMVMPLDMCGYKVLENPVFCPVIFAAYVSSREFEEYHKIACPPKVTIEYTDEIDLEEKMQIEMDKLVSFSPDLIIDMSDEHSILSYLYSQYFPTLYLPMRGYQSSSCFTHFITAEQNVFNKLNQIYHSVKRERVIELPIVISPPPSQTMYSREQYSLSENDFVLVTVGNRLDTEMSEEFIECVCKALLNQSNLKWLVVGSMSEYITEKHQSCLDKQKIIYIPYENDLPALYKICNVYLNPERQGGATSFCWAMHDIPLAMVRMPCDQANTVGLENMIDGTYEQVMDYVLEMQKNPEFYAKEREKFRQRILYFEREQNLSWKKMIENLEDKTDI